MRFLAKSLRPAVWLLAGLAAGCLLSAGSSAAATYYYCPAGLVALGTTDVEAEGSHCAFWLLRTFPLGGSERPDENGSLVAGLDVLPVWQRTRGAGVVVGLLDSGVDPSQSDLAPNLLPGVNTLTHGADTADADGHGTALASVIASSMGNGGYLGIAPQARVLPVKMMAGSDSTGSAEAAVEAVRWAI